MLCIILDQHVQIIIHIYHGEYDLGGFDRPFRNRRGKHSSVLYLDPIGIKFMSIEEDLIMDIKPLIEDGNLDALQIAWEELSQNTEFDRPVAWDYVYQKVYLHAALKKQRSICQWMDELYVDFDPVIQIALRHVFPYARYLLNQ